MARQILNESGPSAVRSPAPIPREHGAWAVLIGAFLCGLLASGRSPGVAAGLLAVSILGFFMAHEPWVKLWRSRRNPPKREVRRRWQRWLVAFLAAGLVPGLYLVGAFQLRWLAAFGVVNGLAFLIHVWLAGERRERSAGAEILGITALSSAAPATHYVLQGELSLATAVLWGLITLFFGGGVFFVKMRVSRFLQPARFADRRKACLLYSVSALACVVLWVIADLVPGAVLGAFGLAAGRAAWFSARPGQTLNLKRIGYFEVGLTLVLVIAMGVGYGIA